MVDPEVLVWVWVCLCIPAPFSSLGLSNLQRAVIFVQVKHVKDERH